MADRGRPKKKIDPEQVRKMAGIGLTVAEIAALNECSAVTVQRRFAKVIEEGRLRRNASLRRKQFEMAMSGNPTMCVWLGKQYLEQADKQEQSGPGGAPLNPPVFNVQFVKPKDAE
jgi:hypothetical protein